MNTNKEQLCLYNEQQVLVVEKGGSMAPQVRYILQDQARLNKHRQLKQASLERRKQRSEIKTEANSRVSSTAVRETK
jgi:hypothetical protein